MIIVSCNSNINTFIHVYLSWISIPFHLILILNMLCVYPLFFSIAEWMYVTEWNTCSATCGGGILTRTQSCVYADNTTAHGVCSGSATTETKDCNTIQCRKLLLGWDGLGYWDIWDCFPPVFTWVTFNLNQITNSQCYITTSLVSWSSLEYLIVYSCKWKVPNTKFFLIR